MNETDAMYEEILQLRAQRQRDALDGQAALDEANNEVRRLQSQVAALTRALEQIDRLGWVERGPLEGGPIDATPKERGMLAYIGRVAAIAQEALAALKSQPGVEGK